MGLEGCRGTWEVQRGTEWRDMEEHGVWRGMEQEYCEGCGGVKRGCTKVALRAQMSCAL